MEECLEISLKGSNTLILDLSLLIKVNFSIKKGVSFALVKKRDNPHHPAFLKLSTTYGVCKYLKLPIDGVVCLCLICHDRDPHHLGS